MSPSCCSVRPSTYLSRMGIGMGDLCSSCFYLDSQSGGRTDGRVKIHVGRYVSDDLIDFVHLSVIRYPHLAFFFFLSCLVLSVYLGFLSFFVKG